MQTDFKKGSARIIKVLNVVFGAAIVVFFKTAYCQSETAPTSSSTESQIPSTGESEKSEQTEVQQQTNMPQVNQLSDMASDKSNNNTQPSTDQKPQPSAAKVKQKPKDPGQDAQIKIDGSAVYSKPNFDSPIMEYLDQGKTVKISRKIYPGIGGLGAFYKVRLKKGVYGYITDIDVAVLDKNAKVKPPESKKPNRNSEPEMDDPTQIQSEMEAPDNDYGSSPIYLTPYLGVAYYQYNYVEKIKNTNKTSSMPMFGFRKSGPGSIMGGMPLDLGVLVAFKAPGFYSDIASSVSGFMLIADGLVTMPIYETKKILVYYGLGLVFRYSKWSVNLSNQSGRPALDSQEAAIGAAGEFGAAYLLTKTMAIRTDAKYYFENQKYFGVGATLQVKF